MSQPEKTEQDASEGVDEDLEEAAVQLAEDIGCSSVDSIIKGYEAIIEMTEPPEDE